MKVPAGLLDPQGLVAKGVVHLEANGSEIEEFGLTVTGKHSTCYVTVCPGDVITANLALNSGITNEFADLVVDGILRNSWPNNRGQKVFKYIFDRAVYAGNLIGETRKRKAMKYARMQVIERNTQKDFRLESNQVPSAVSSIQVQIYRKKIIDHSTTKEQTAEVSSSGNDSGSGDANRIRAATQDGSGSGSGSGNGDATDGDAAAEGANINLSVPKLDILQRVPNFVKYPTWQDLNRCIGSDLVPPRFEIGFFDGTKQWPKLKERVLKEYTGDYQLWASFTFLLRSSADLRALGFEKVNLHYSSNLSMSTAFPSTVGPLTIDAVQADEPINAPFKSDEREYEDDDNPVVVAVIQPKMTRAIKEPKQVIAGEPPTSKSQYEATNATKKGEADETVIASIFAAANEPKPQKSKYKLKTKELETREQYIARKKVDLVLPGVKSAPAQQAWLQRGATEEPEEEENVDVEHTSAHSIQKSGLVNTWTSSLHNFFQTSTSNNQSLATQIPRIRCKSSPPALALRAHCRDGRRPFIPATALSAPASPDHKILTSSVSDFSGTQRTPPSQILPIEAPGERHPTIRLLQSDLRPSTPPSQKFDTCAKPGLSDSPILIVQADQILQGLKQRRLSLATMSSSRPPEPQNDEEGTNCLVPGGTSAALRANTHGISSIITSDTPRPSLSVARSIWELVTGVDAHSFPVINRHNPAPHSFSRMSSCALKNAAIKTECQAGKSLYEQPYGMGETESCKTPTPSSSEPSRIQTLPQEDFEVTRTKKTSSTVSAAQSREIHTQTQPRDPEKNGMTRSPSPDLLETEIQIVNQDEERLFTTSRPSLPGRSKSPDEVITKASSLSALETGWRSIKRDTARSLDNNFSLPEATFWPQLQPQGAILQNSQENFNHTHESPILGSSQRLLVAPEASRFTRAVGQARLPRPDLIALYELLPEEKESQCPVQNEDQKDTTKHLLAPSMPETDSIVHPKLTMQCSEVILLSPPLSAHKRKADSITGVELTFVTHPCKIPCSNENRREGWVLDTHEKQPKRATENSEREREAAQVDQHNTELTARIEAKRTRDTAHQQARRDSGPRWEEEIRRQNEVARARMVAAENQRKKLQAKYEAALTLQKEREKVKELNDEAERLERQNAELQTTISALYRGELV